MKRDSSLSISLSVLTLILSGTINFLLYHICAKQTEGQTPTNPAIHSHSPSEEDGEKPIQSCLSLDSQRLCCASVELTINSYVIID